MVVVAARDLGEASADWPADVLEVGRIGEAWGLKGWVKVQPYAADAPALRAAGRWFVRPPLGALTSVRSGAAQPSKFEIVCTRLHGDGLVAQLNGIGDRGAAEALRGARIFVSRSVFPPPAVDEYYWVDLIGMAVVNRESEYLGVVFDLFDTGPHSVMRVRSEDLAASRVTVAEPAQTAHPVQGGVTSETAEATAGAAPETASAAHERLIPFVAAYVDAVDLEARRITVDWGLDF